MPNIRLSLFILLGLAFSVPASVAEETKAARWYQVNLTVFKQKTDRKLDESFTAQALTLDMPDLVQLKHKPARSQAKGAVNAPLAFNHEAVTNRSPFLEQSIDDNWIEVLSKLDPATQPILYNSQWVQPVYDQEFVTPLYFESSLQHLNQPQLRGIMRLHVSRYLHANFQVNYWPEAANSFEDLVSFETSRRMRSKEVHYIDHPLVGVLLQILPATNPAAGSSSQNQNAGL